MTIDLNKFPYFDDYDKDKGFYKVLFKPGSAVQARELTQLQTILEKQISRFGSHVFKEGSIVLGGQFNVELNVQTISVDSSTLSLADLRGAVAKTVTGAITGLRAYVLAFANKDDWGLDNHVLFVRYLNSGETETEFLPNEPLDIGFTVAAVDPRGVGSIFSISEGTVFTKGYFVSFQKQTVILSPNSSIPSRKVGFQSDEVIVTADQDESLLDNAQGSLNFAAPGADRLAIIPRLISVPLEEDIPQFVSLFSVNRGNIVTFKERSEFSRLGDEIAKRTLDESGDYVVRGFGVRVREHLDTGLNEGYLSSEEGGDVNKLAYGIESGLGYVKGYEINKLVTEYVEADKSLLTQQVNNEILSFRAGNYITIEEVVGGPTLDNAETVTFYDTAENRVTNKVPSSTLPTGIAIGTAKVKTFLNNGNGTYDLYLFDIQLNSGFNVSDIRSVRNSNFFADTVLSSGSTLLLGTNEKTQIVQLGSNYVNTVRSETGTIDTIFTSKRTFTPVSVPVGGVFSVTVTQPNEVHSYGTSGSLIASDKLSFHVYTLEDAFVTLDGTVSGTIGTTSLNGLGTFFTNLNIGDKLQITGVSGIYRIVSIADNDTLVVDAPFASSFSAVTFIKAYQTGDIIDLTTKGYTNNSVRDVDVVTNKTLTINLNETFDSELSVAVSFNITRNSAREAAKQKRSSRFVRINCSTIADLTAPICLGFSDVIKIKAIRKDTTQFTDNLTWQTQGTDVLSGFILDNGQRDDFYDNAYIIPRITLAPTDFLIVQLDYFQPNFSQGLGYFSVDSYPINDTIVSDTTINTAEIPAYKSSTGDLFDLRGCLDFRPVKTNSSSDSITVVSSSINPVSSNTFFNSPGLRIPVPSSQIITDYSFYLARRDVLTLDKDGKYSIIYGIPDVYPVTPEVPQALMPIAGVYVPPYPSLSPTAARVLNIPIDTVIINKVTNKRYTMKDIGALDQRIQNLEYYNSVSLLEKSAFDLQILDENGLDRFKNGFFVDDFVDHSLGATYNRDYNISVDREETVIRPVFTMDSFKLQYKESESSGVQKTGNLITLPYTEETLIEQTRVTTTRNIEQSVFRFIGRMTINPDVDVWVDTVSVDRVISKGDVPQTDKILSTEWGAWQTYITGVNNNVTIGNASETVGGGVFNAYARQFGDRSLTVNSTDRLIGSFSSYAEASNAIKKAGISRAKIESIGTELGEFKERSGVQTIQKSKTTTDELGSYLTDISIVPYIRPQVIDIYVEGLKANTKFSLFFDGENMNSFVTPVDVITGISTGLEGTEWRSNDAGQIRCNLRLPTEGKRFRVGTKEISVTDSPTNAIDATSYSKGYFYASGLNAKRQNTFISTTETVIDTTTVSQREKQTIEILGPSCAAYSFFVEVPDGEEGAFITSVDVFIESKHPTLGCWFEIREMSADGNITRTQIPYSEVWYTSAEITTTSDATVPHKVIFPSPVYLLNNTQYAFVIHTEGLNPDYYFWVSRLGETDIITKQPVTGRQLTGSFYTTNNNLNWDIVPDIDLKVKFNRASFVTNTTGTAILGNRPVEFMTVGNNENGVTFNNIGEKIAGSQYVVFSNISGGNILEGDIIRKIGTTQNAEVISILGEDYYTDGFALAPGDSVEVLNPDTSPKGVTGTLLSVKGGLGTLYSFNSSNSRMTVKDSNGEFFVGGSIKGLDTNVTSTVVEFNEYEYATANLKPRFIRPANTLIGFESRGVILGTGQFGPWERVNPDSTYQFKDSLTIKSRNSEIALYSSDSTVKTRSNLFSVSEYVSPVIDIGSANTVLIKSEVNNDITGEDGQDGGNLINKYISKIITLDEGQDAEDLLVSLTNYIPPGTDVKVWVKIRNVEDGEQLEDKYWIEMEKNNDVFSSRVNQFDFRSFDYKFPVSLMTGVDGQVQYTTNGNTYTGFRQFQIKIGLLSTDGAIVPRVSDLRAIALQL